MPHLTLYNIHGLDFCIFINRNYKGVWGYFENATYNMSKQNNVLLREKVLCYSKYIQYRKSYIIFLVKIQNQQKTT